MDQDCCRICLSKTQSIERQDLFSEEENNLSVLGQLYEEVLNIPIAVEKITLRYICNSCGLQLKLFKQLKNKALETYLLLNELLIDIPYKDDNPVENENDENKPFESNVLPTDTDSLNSSEFKDAYYIENEVNTLIADDINCEDNEQQEDDVTQNDITENEITDNEITENDITENDITENGIAAESDIIENYLDENDIAKIEQVTEDDMLGQNEGQQEDEFISLEEFIKCDQNINLDTPDEEEYEICYLDEDAILENQKKEIEQEEYDEESLIDEENIDENNPTSKTIEDETLFPCTHCDETFKLKSQLKSHKRKVHSVTTKIQCNLCDKMFYAEDTYQAHMNVHNGLPAYQCHICEKAFNQKVHYNYHILNHNNERRNICDICQKGFISNGDLKTHMRSHTDERRFKCNVCEKRFRSHTHMVTHRYSHFEKQFECPACYQKYMSPNTLRTHFKAVHNAEVPFECKFCEKRFKRKHHLQAHYKTHAKLMGDVILS